MGHSRSLSSFVFSTTKDYKLKICCRWLDLNRGPLYRKRLLCQLSHNYCPHLILGDGAALYYLSDCLYEAFNVGNCISLLILSGLPLNKFGVKTLFGPGFCILNIILIIIITLRWKQFQHLSLTLSFSNSLSLSLSHPHAGSVTRLGDFWKFFVTWFLSKKPKFMVNFWA